MAKLSPTLKHLSINVSEISGHKICYDYSWCSTVDNGGERGHSRTVSEGASESACATCH